MKRNFLAAAIGALLINTSRQFMPHKSWQNYCARLRENHLYTYGSYPPWVHCAGTHRAACWIYLDGKKMSRVLFADEMAGMVRVLNQPIEIMGDELATTEHFGKVTVKYLSGPGA